MTRCKRANTKEVLVSTTVQVTELGPNAMHALEHVAHDLTEIRIALHRIASAIESQATVAG
jgi:hypothetical protein